MLFIYNFWWYETNQNTLKHVAEFSLVLGTVVVILWPAWSHSWDPVLLNHYLAAPHCRCFPNLPLPLLSVSRMQLTLSHLTHQRGAGVPPPPCSLNAQAGGKGWATTPAEGWRFTMAAAFFGVNGWTTSETAHPALAHLAPRIWDGLSAHTPLTPSSNTCLQLMRCSCRPKRPYDHWGCCISQWSGLLSVFSVLNTRKLLENSPLILTIGRIMSFLCQGTASLVFILTEQLHVMPELSWWEKAIALFSYKQHMLFYKCKCRNINQSLCFKKKKCFEGTFSF